MKQRLFALLLTLALLITCAVVTVNASNELDSTTSAPDWESSAPESGFDSADTPCPHCVETNASDTTPTWTQYTGTGTSYSSGTRHIYIDSESGVYNLTSQIKVTGGTTVVWIKPGVSLVAGSGANAFRAQGGNIWILGGTDSVVTGPGATGQSYNGGLMRVMNANSNVYICGDVTIQLNRENNTVTSGEMGGLVDVYSGNLYMRGGTMIGPVDASSGVVRGAVLVSGSAGNFYMSGGRIKGNGVNEGSAITFNSTGKLEISGSAYVEGYSGEATEGGGYAIYLTKAATVNVKGGTVKGGAITGTHEVNGSAIYMSTGVLNVSSGVVYGGTATNGGAIYQSGGTTTITGGTINGGTATSGGAIYQGGGTATITGGTINGGTATSGGAIYVAGGSLTMNSDTNNPNGGTVSGGEAASGGAIYLDTNASFTLTNGTVNGTNITDETTTVINGGAIYSVATGTDAVQLNGGTINGGTVARAANSSKGITSLKGRGGAIYVNGGKLKLGGVQILGGKAHEGGALYINAGTVNMTAGSISGADGLSNGGTAFIKSTFNMSGGTITVNPNNTYEHSKGLRVVGSGIVNLSGTAKVISPGEREGDGVYVVSTTASSTAKVTLAGQAQVVNTSGTYEDNIFISNWGPDKNDTVRYASHIQVKAGWSGTASVKFGYIHSTDYAEPDAEYTIGMAFPAAYASATGDFSGTLYMETADLNPTLWWDGATGLKASDVQIRTDGEITWMKNNDAAVTDYTDGYIKLFNTNALNLAGKTVFVDFNGNSSAVTLAGGKLCGFDSTATIEVPGSARVTVTDGSAESYAVNPVTRKTAFAREIEGVTTFHVVEVAIESVSLRPGTAGIYYGAKFLCDDVLKEYVESFGIAVSLSGMPGEDFATNKTVLYTANGKETYGADSYNSVLINKIMHNGNDTATNKARAEAAIYANAYMILNIEGKPVTVMANTTAQLSLKDVMKRIDKVWHSLDAAAQNNVISKIYEPYVAQFAVNDWDLINMTSSTADKNRELKVLTIGNSLSVDAGRMLAYVAQQEGSVGFKVGTLYKANCSVQEHADFLTNNKPNYWYYESTYDAENAGTLTTGSLVPSETKNFVGYDAIVADDWDIIIMQHSVFGSARANTYDESIDTIIDYVNTHKTNPDAIFVWNMTWMGPVDKELLKTAEATSPGFDKSYISYTKDPLDREAQTMMYEQIAGAVQEKIFSDNRFAYILPSATMMQNALTATSDKVMYRDYIHGSDYGRLMNAYLWYSMLTGKTITDPAVDTIPGALRFAAANQSSDLALSERMKNVLVESVNNAIKNPFGTTQSKYQKEESLKVLAIGNSFSVDSMWHLEEVARSEGYTDIKIATLFIGGCTLKTHWAKANGDLADYTYYYNYDGNWKQINNYSIAQALQQQDWDIITLQQASGSSGQADTYESYLGNLVNYLQTNAPDAKILWHMTWAYAQSSTHTEFPKYDSDQTKMYNAIVGAYQSAVLPYLTAGDIAGLIPSGTAIQNIRTSHIGDNVNRDGYHLNLMGRVVAACTWYTALTGNDLDELSAFYFADNDISGQPTVTLTNADRAAIVAAVQNAVANPCQITPVAQ